MNISKLTFPISLISLFALVFLAKASIDYTHQHTNDLTSSNPNAADIGFAQDMAVHHNQAVEMSELAISRGTDQVKLWGARIRGIQLQEIGRFMGWLDIWNAPHIASDPMVWMNDDSNISRSMDKNSSTDMNHDHSHHHNDIIVAMGMATPDEMNQLRSLTGEAFDVLFLQLMIRHHQGGVLMAQAGIDKAATYTVRNVCKVIAQGQSKEIFDMAMLLKARGEEMLPFGVPTPDKMKYPSSNPSSNPHGHHHKHHAAVTKVVKEQPSKS